jgi:cell division topological specificity factor
MQFLRSLLGRRQPTARQIAKERLQLVLVHDRIMISPGLLELMKDELIAVISKYVEIDADSVQVSLSQGPNQGRLTVDIPVSGPLSKRPAAQFRAQDATDAR